MTTRPVLIVHGIANHEREPFEARVAQLQIDVRARGLALTLIPVFWGDLGGKSRDIRDCLPVLRNGQWQIRDALTNAERAAVIAEGIVSEGPLREADDARMVEEIEESLDKSARVRTLDNPDLLRAIGVVLREAQTADGDDAREYVVRAGGDEATRGWAGERTRRLVQAIDALLGKAAEAELGTLNQLLRGSMMNGVAASLGDIVAYEANRQAIQDRLWDAIDEWAPESGTEGNPASVIAHSLGGVVAFDTIVAPVRNRTLHVDGFVTFGSQAAFFEIIRPRAGALYRSGQPIRLPRSLKRWFNLWSVADILAFTAGTVFRLSDGTPPEDVVVLDPISDMLEEKLWLHSIYWRSPVLLSVLERAFPSRKRK